MSDNETDDAPASLVGFQIASSMAAVTGLIFGGAFLDRWVEPMGAMLWPFLAFVLVSAFTGLFYLGVRAERRKAERKRTDVAP